MPVILRCLAPIGLLEGFDLGLALQQEIDAFCLDLPEPLVLGMEQLELRDLDLLCDALLELAHEILDPLPTCFNLLL